MKIILKTIFMMSFSQIIYASMLSHTLEINVHRFRSFSSVVIKRNVSHAEKILPPIKNIKDALDIMDRLKSDPYYFNPRELESHHYKASIPFPFGVWFRGASKHFYDLKPSLLRESYPEFTLINDFKLKNPEGSVQVRSATRLRFF